MKSNPLRQNRSIDKSQALADELLQAMFMQGKALWGEAVQSFWFYDGDLCPGCMAHPIEAIKFKGQEGLALNAFIYRPRRVLIGYFLCECCVVHVFQEAEAYPYRDTPLHHEIERNLIAGYHRFLASLDA